MDDTRRERLVGIVVSLPTFCDESHNLLLDRQRLHIRWLIERGMTEGNGVLLIAGGSGEGYFLDDDEWRTLADVVVEEAAGKVPTMIGLFELSARRAAKKASWAADAGVDFIQMAPPHYIGPSEDEVFRHYQYANDAADVGILAYNIPWAMPAPAFELTESLVERFASLNNMVGIKWASNSSTHFTKILRLFADRFNFIDNMHFEGMLSHGARLGARGIIDLHCNVAPALSLRKWELLRDKRYDEYDAIELKMRFDPTVRLGVAEEAGGVTMGEGSRLVLSALGMETGPPFPALEPPPQEAVRAYREAFAESGVLGHVEWDQTLFDSLGQDPAPGAT